MMKIKYIDDLKFMFFKFKIRRRLKNEHRKIILKTKTKRKL